MNLNPCRCGNKPELVTQLNGLVRISCVLAKCNEIVCARSGMAHKAWNEINPLVDEEQTSPSNPVPLVPKHKPYIAQEPSKTRLSMPAARVCIYPPADDEIPVTVELPDDELPTEPTGGLHAQFITGTAVATAWHQGYRMSLSDATRERVGELVQRELISRRPELVMRMAKAYAVQLQHPPAPLCERCGYQDSLGFICDAIREYERNP
jgi:hypothetical protein